MSLKTPKLLQGNVAGKNFRSEKLKISKLKNTTIRFQNQKITHHQTFHNPILSVITEIS